jgi:hypothetical protein
MRSLGKVKIVGYYIMSYIKPNTDYEVGMFLMENVAKRRGGDDDNTPDGWFNHLFEHEPTTEQAMDWVNRTWFIPNKKADLYKAKRMNKLMKDEDPNLISSRIITLQFDKKNRKEVADPKTFNRAFCEIYVEEMRKSNYKFIVNGKMTFEFWTKEGWNPHIHIYTETDKQIGAIAQVLRRKFIEKSKWKIWNIDVKAGKPSYQAGYCDVPEGLCDEPDNVILKCDDKKAYALKDSEFRQQNNIQNSYDI